jgi:hypothetical protein
LCRPCAVDAGNVSIDTLDPGKRAQLNFKDYEKPGDTLGAEVDLTHNSPLAITVSSYLEDPSDLITMNANS